MRGEAYSASAETHTTWLSGAITTFVSKLVMPAIWLAILAGVPLWVYITRGRISIRTDAQFIVWLALIATVPLTWVTVHLQSVGYRGPPLPPVYEALHSGAGQWAAWDLLVEGLRAANRAMGSGFPTGSFSQFRLTLAGPVGPRPDDRPVVISAARVRRYSSIRSDSAASGEPSAAHKSFMIDILARNHLYQSHSVHSIEKDHGRSQIESHLRPYSSTLARRPYLDN